MAITNQIMVVGNLTADPELKFTPNGVPMAKLSIASTEQKWNRETNQREDGDVAFFNVTVWRDMAENVAATLSKGSRVVAIGKMKQRSYEDDAGVKKTTWEFDVEEIGPSLRWARGTITKHQSNRTQQSNQEQYAAQQQDAWASNVQLQSQQAAWAVDEAPF